MRINILGQSFRLTDAIEQHVKDRIRSALGAASAQVTGACVRLTDVNSNRGGIDKRCRIVVWLRPLYTVVVEAVHSDLYDAIDEAASRVKDAVWRQLKRRHTLRREHANRPLRRLLV